MPSQSRLVPPLLAGGGPGEGSASAAPRPLLALLQSNAGRFVLLAGPCLLYLAIFYLFPLARLIPLSLAAEDGQLANYIAFFERDVYRVALFRTFWLSLLVTVATIAIGFPLAYFLASRRPSTAQALMFFVLLPFWTSLLVRSYAWVVLLQPNGVINKTFLGLGLIEEPIPLLYNLYGVIIGMTHVLLPFMVMPLYAVLVGIDKSLHAAAASMGARPHQRFLKVTLPLTAPGLAAGSIIVFVLALGFFIIPAILGGSRVLVLATLIEMQVNQLGNWSFAATCALVLLVFTAALLMAAQKAFGLTQLYDPKAA